MAARGKYGLASISTFRHKEPTATIGDRIKKQQEREEKRKEREKKKLPPKPPKNTGVRAPSDFKKETIPNQVWSKPQQQHQQQQQQRQNRPIQKRARDGEGEKGIADDKKVKRARLSYANAYDFEDENVGVGLDGDGDDADVDNDIAKWVKKNRKVRAKKPPPKLAQPQLSEKMAGKQKLKHPNAPLRSSFSYDPDVMSDGYGDNDDYDSDREFQKELKSLSRDEMKVLLKGYKDYRTANKIL